jgi:hypothetical protein
MVADHRDPTARDLAGRQYRSSAASVDSELPGVSRPFWAGFKAKNNNKINGEWW